MLLSILSLCNLDSTFLAWRRPVPMETMKVQCPHCAAVGTIRGGRLMGRKIDCPRCKNPFPVEQPRHIGPGPCLSDPIGADEDESRKKAGLPIWVGGAIVSCAVLLALGLPLWIIVSNPSKANNQPKPIKVASIPAHEPDLGQASPPLPVDTPETQPDDPIATDVADWKPEEPGQEEPLPEPVQVAGPIPVQPVQPFQPMPPAKTEPTAPKNETVHNQGIVQNGQGGIFGGQVQGLGTSVNLSVQAVITGDRNFVRLSLNPSFTVAVQGPPRYIPLTVPVFPTRLRPGQGPSPIVFYNVVQQPAFNNINLATTVLVPAGGSGGVGGFSSSSMSSSSLGGPPGGR
jgi:hypothetical protein